MCCRYYVEPQEYTEALAEKVKESRFYRDNLQRIAKGITGSGEICPGSLVAALAPNKAGQRRAYPMIWGYRIIGLSHPLVNARCETASEKETFRESFSSHRCAIPFTHYYEWEHFVSADGKTKTGDRYLIMPKGQELSYFCGLYRIEDGYPYFVILTREAAEDIAFIHNRMPVIISRDTVDCWISPSFNPHMVLKESLTEMIFSRE